MQGVTENNMTEERPDPVPFQTHESDMARMENSIKRLSFALAVVSVVAVLVIALCVFLMYKNNMKWVEAWASYEYESEEVTVNGDNSGNAQYIGDSANYTEGNGDRHYGEDNSQANPAD